MAEVGRQIQEVVYSAELIIDAHLCRAAAAQGKIELFRRHRALETEPASSLAEEVRSLREDMVKPMLEKVRTEFAEMLQIGDGSQAILEEPHQIKLDKVPLISRDTVVGIEDEKDLLTLFYLIGGTEELDVIPIIDRAGTGKTKLAWEIYQSEEIRYEFPTRIWVYVSRDLNLKDVFLTILKEVASKDMSSMSDCELALVVRGFLDKRRFLLVLDDVWDCNHFIAIRDAFPESNRMGSRVLITSRSMNLAEYANPHVSPSRIRLTFDKSWDILESAVFGKLGSCPKELIHIGRDIAAKCMGLPLVIVIIGGILLDHLSKSQSMNAVGNEWRELSESLGFSELDECIETSVALSYNSLPDDLRNMFLYFGVSRRSQDSSCDIDTLVDR